MTRDQEFGRDDDISAVDSDIEELLFWYLADREIETVQK
jgi:hypothetical protein